MTVPQVPQNPQLVNGVQQPQVAPQPTLAQKVEKVYDIGIGRYDVTVTVGPSYQSKRSEAVQSLLAFMQAVPTAAPFIADLIARNSDWPGSKEMADRLEKMLPPQLQDDDDNDPAAMAQKYKTQLDQLSQQHEQLTQSLHAAMTKIETKQQETDAKVHIAQLAEATKVSIAKMDADVKLAIAEISTKAQIAQVRTKSEQDAFAMIHGDAHEAEVQAQDHAQEAQIQAFGQQHGQGMQADAQQHQAEQATQTQGAQADQAAQAQQAQAEQSQNQEPGE